MDNLLEISFAIVSAMRFQSVRSFNLKLHYMYIVAMRKFHIIQIITLTMLSGNPLLVLV